MTMLQTEPEHHGEADDVDLFALLCRRRGWTPEFLQQIESAEHAELLGVPEMVQALDSACAGGQKVVIAPDFDMDGIASGVLGYAGLSELGFDVELHLPDYNRGHDLTPQDVAEIAVRWPQTQVLLTCDGGVNSHAGIAAAHARGWTVLVTDHHEELPPGCSADVTVDPCRLDETYANPGICGAHVLLQVLESYTRQHQPHKTWEIRLLRLFAGLGTVSDVMPVLFENRQLVRDSLSIARLLWVSPPRPNGPYSSAQPELIDVERATLMQLLRLGGQEHHPVFVRAFRGMATVLKAFTMAGKLRDAGDLDEGFWGFYVAPAMNSPRRTGDALVTCFSTLTAADPSTMLDSALTMIAVNERRKQLTQQHLEQLQTQDQPLAPWVYFSDAPRGMLGLLANQLMAAAGHPVVVLSRPTDAHDPVSGSGRAPSWFDIITTLRTRPGLSAAGHQQACGVHVQRAELVVELAGTLSEATGLALLVQDDETPAGDLVLGPDADCDAGLDDLQPLLELARRTHALKPFGHGFSEPVVQIALEPLALRVDRIGSERQHLRLVTRSGLSCLWWNAAEEHYDQICQTVLRASRTDVGTLRFLVRLRLNTFRDDTRVQAVIEERLTAAR